MERDGLLQRPERVALVLAVLAVAGGLIGTGVRVANGIDDRQVEFSGKLDAREILAHYHPDPKVGTLRKARGRPLTKGEVFLSEAKGVGTVHRATGAQLTAWSLLRLAPWLLAALALALSVPILRGAERGDPFSPGAARRLAVVGSILFLGIPALAGLEYVFASGANSHGIAPTVEPTLTIGVLHFLPGALLLALAAIFRRGAELRDLERHTV